MCGRHRRLGELHAKILAVFLPRLSHLFCLLPPESFKIICLTCIWLKFVTTSVHSSQKPPIYLCRIYRHFSSQFFKNRCVNLWNQAHNWLNLLTSCGPNLDSIGSYVIFCVPVPLPSLESSYTFVALCTAITIFAFTKKFFLHNQILVQNHFAQGQPSQAIPLNIARYRKAVLR